MFPPQVKPTNNFGIPEDELQFVNELIQTKNVLLYLFGNPYVLNKIDMANAKTIVVAYQNFKVFQQTAVQHFLGSIETKGKLPITIDQQTK